MWNTNGFKIKLHLIRHGKTYANENRLYYGFSDIDISEKGKEDLILLKKEIKYPTGDFFITSGLKRTIQTLEIIYGKKQFIINENLKEMNFGDFELKSYEQLKENKDYIKWIENIEENEIPNGETKNQFENRTLIGFSNIFKSALNNNFKDIVVICHGGVISIFMENMFKNKYNFYEWLPSYGRGYTVTFDENNEKYYEKI